MAKFRPRARIIRTIGDQLISGPEAALIELVKNSYDADSPYVLIKITPPSTGQSVGEILVSDNGHGMSERDVLDKWLEPATDDKLQRRESAEGRPMLGAKGIGRFAASRLGTFTRLETIFKPENGPKTLTTLEVDWSKFDAAHYLDEIELIVSTQKLPIGSRQSVGVDIHIRGLRDTWTQKRLEALIRELRRVASPTDKWMSDFKIRLDLTAFNPEEFGFDGQSLITGFNSNSRDTKDDSVDDPFQIKPFSIQKHADYRLTGKFDRYGAFRGQFRNFRGDQTTDTFEVPALSGIDEEASCGEFSLKINVYDREKESLQALFERMGVNFDKVGIQAARRIISENAGISIFRKGFRIRPYGDPENDWLEMERQRVQDPSRKLGISQVSGIVEIADERLSGLVERSSREGLEHNDSFERLKNLILNVLLHVEERRLQFRQRAGLSRRIHGDLQRVRDIAELKRVVRAVKALPEPQRTVLETAIEKDRAELSTELDDITEYQQALQSRSAIGLVVAEVIHEGRRHLEPIASSAKMLLNGVGAVLEQNRRGEVYRKQLPEHASIIHDGARDLGRLFKRLDPITGRRRGRPKNFEVLPVIERSLSFFSDRVSEIKANVVVDCAGDIFAYGYEDDLQAVLMNVIDNGIHWLGTMSGKRLLSLNVAKGPKNVTIRVENNGPPVDDAYIPRLFDAGFTLKAGGTGLGLAIAREAIRRSKGDLIYDDAAVDTTFVIKLPRENAQ